MVARATTARRQTVFVPRRDADASGGDAVTGYLYVSADLPWPDDPVTEGSAARSLARGRPTPASNVVTRTKQKYLPTRVWVDPDGTQAADGDGLQAWFMSTPFAFCMRCRVSYEQVRGSDFAKLATLDQEGRSSAVTVVQRSIVRALQGLGPDELASDARKLLTFVDNRQDASLQAGHFNDFVQVTQLRGGSALPRSQRHPGRADARAGLGSARSTRCDLADHDRLRGQPAGQVLGQGPAPSAPCARSSSTGSTPTCSAGGG